MSLRKMCDILPKYDLQNLSNKLPKDDRPKTMFTNNFDFEKNRKFKITVSRVKHIVTAYNSNTESPRMDLKFHL